MGSISGTLITVRSGKQGAEMVNGKSNKEYKTEISTLRINAEDLAELGVTAGQTAVMKSPYGQIEVICRQAEGPRGFFFLPLGPVANQIFSSQTAGTGVPDWKGMTVTLVPVVGSAKPLAATGMEECE
ncbi:molybdopterin dinucleotide binding domain-containing protein [Sporomusa sphaeroides]|uniref:molybdopterin dinucleotide binding domain-containing protein n=1 Tax=Sporomusa sphaeroides TaxID=47679 RepID=UPI00202E1509|nr:molybdopterin dinucleotide binding domain-containing protein [Sporomusa sphaeroides]MCM0759194.1 hypothetical protein [Sporomusa sphaeroides DSM 2875]HML35276.1 molybdopterin dinucleotide binding domain-containing protein [Sporomusa sphaeroides]